MKKTSIILYILYSVAIILILTFGQSASHYVINWFEVRLNEVKITDVSVSIDEGAELLAGRSYPVSYTAEGKFRGDPGLVFTSLDPERLTVSENGSLSTKLNFDGDFFDARVKITSEKDKDFEKVITYRFVKKYPEDFKVSYYLKGHSYGAKVLYIGVPVYVNSIVSSGQSYNMSDHRIVYDAEYFEELPDGTLIPIKTTPAGEKLEFSVVYGDGTTAASESFEIAEQTLTEVDEVKINDVATDEYKAEKGELITLTFFKDGEKVASDFSLTFDDESDVTLTRASSFSFNSAGDKAVTVTLPGGFSKTFFVKIEKIDASIANKVPQLADTDVQKSHHIDLVDTDVKTFMFDLKEDLTKKNIKYEYDSDIMELTSNSEGFTITAKKAGTATLKIIIDDGVSRAEESYTVEIKEDRSFINVFAQNIKKFVSKVLGHGLMFFVLAIFAMNMFKYCEVENPIIRFSLYTLTGLPVGAITEYIQTFIPGRTGRVLDVIIDMTGFYIGTLIVVLVRACIRGIKGK